MRRSTCFMHFVDSPLMKQTNLMWIQMQKNFRSHYRNHIFSTVLFFLLNLAAARLRKDDTERNEVE